MTTTGVGAPAPPLELPSATGDLRSLQEFHGRPVVVSFLGPSNCQFCRAHVIKMIQARDEIRAAGAEVVLVAYNDPELVMSQLFRSLDLPFLLLVDKGREAYQSWGLGQADWRTLLNPALYWNVARMAMRRPKPLGRAPTTSQLGGDFVIDRDGKIVFVNRMKSIYDRAPVSDLLAAITGNVRRA
jgi:peroxiredoxin